MTRSDFLRTVSFGLLGALCAPLSGKGEFVGERAEHADKHEWGNHIFSPLRSGGWDYVPGTSRCEQISPDAVTIFATFKDRQGHVREYRNTYAQGRFVIGTFSGWIFDASNLARPHTGDKG